jgi:hypothetical protein
VYRARSLPLSQLQSTVRTAFIPQHYPDSIERMYSWTPDEATHEFYMTSSQPSIFKSRHEEMCDITLPRWCSGNEDTFIAYHRRLLESDHVSLRLHHWIDLNFGDALAGERAVAEKNVVLHRVSWSGGSCMEGKDQCIGDCHSVFSGNATDESTEECQKSLNKSVFVQLFLSPHPEKIVNTNVSRIEAKPRVSDHAADFALRKQHDISLIGAILKECYSSAKVIPPFSVDAAINDLLSGTHDVKRSLKGIAKGEATDKRFPFPPHLQDLYTFMSNIQSASFKRGESDSLVNGHMGRSSDLERVWAIIRKNHNLEVLSDASIALMLPTLLSPLNCTRAFIENSLSSSGYASFPERLCSYIIQMSRKVPAALVVPSLLRFLDHSSKLALGSLAITNALGKVYLSHDLLPRLYLRSSWEGFVKQLTTFMTSQLRRMSTTSETGSLESKEQMRIKSVVSFFVSFVAHDDVLGMSISCRYIIPSLVRIIDKCSSNDNENQCVQVMKLMMPFQPEDVLGVLICKPILRILSQHLSSLLRPVIPTVLYVTDLVALLQFSLRHLDSNHILQYFFQSNSGTISQLLLASFEATTQDKELEKLNDLFRDVCLLLSDMILKVDPEHFKETLFPIIEALSSQMNDRYLTISLRRSIGSKEFEWSEIMLLPGICNGCTLVGKIASVCERETLRTCCPSALELLSWAAKSEDSSPKGINPPVNRTEEVKRHSANTEARSREEEGRISFGRILKTSTSSEKDIEMLAPARDTSYDDLPPTIDDTNPYGVPQRQNKERSSTHSMQFVYDEQLSKQKRDLAWVMGLHRRKMDDSISYSWQPRMMTTTKLDFAPSIGSDGSIDTRASITCMSTNASESMLLAGNSIGEVLLFDLRRQPPSLMHRQQVPFNTHDGTVNPISQADFFNREESVLVCDGGLHQWDIETQKIRSSLSRDNAYHNDNTRVQCPWQGDRFVKFSVFPKLSGHGELIDASFGEIAAITPNHLCTIDMRCRRSVATYEQLVQSGIASSCCEQPPQFDSMFEQLIWNIDGVGYSSEHLNSRKKTIPEAEPLSSFKLNCITTHCGEGDWICVGSSSGHIHLFDRRRGKLVICWKAHSLSIEYLQSVSRHRLLSVSADKTAVVWDLSRNPPQKVSSICNLPGKENTMNISSHQFQAEDGLVSIPGGDFLLCCVTGRKAVFQPMSLHPNLSNEDNIDIKAERIVMSNWDGSSISSSSKLNISSVALLPCRQLVLLGCDGEIHVCL